MMSDVPAGIDIIWGCGCAQAVMKSPALNFRWLDPFPVKEEAPRFGSWLLDNAAKFKAQTAFFPPRLCCCKPIL